MEREAQRAHRMKLAEQKASAKQALLDASADAAVKYERFIEFLVDAHRVSLRRRDWAAIANSPTPAKPELGFDLEKSAQRSLDEHAPGWFARTFGGAKRERARLHEAIARAKANDKKAYDEALATWEQRRSEIELAQAVIAGKDEATKTAIQTYADFGSVAVEGLRFACNEKRVVAIADGYEREDLPSNTVTLLQSGKASIKPISAKRQKEIHRDNVCASALRIAVETLQALPIEAVEVVVLSDILDAGSGHIAPRPVLYGRFTAQALLTVNLVQADPTLAAERLGAQFDFSGRDGLRAIDVERFDIANSLLLGDQ